MALLIRVAGLALLFVAISLASDGLSVLSLDDQQPDCYAAHTANVAYEKRCNSADLGDTVGVSKNSLEDINGLDKMNKEQLLEVVQKFRMAFALEKRSAISMRTDFRDKLKKCAKNTPKNEPRAKLHSYTGTTVLPII